MRTAAVAGVAAMLVLMVGAVGCGSQGEAGPEGTAPGGSASGQGQPGQARSGARATLIRESFPDLLDESGALRMELDSSVGTFTGHAVISWLGDNIGQIAYILRFDQGSAQAIGYARQAANRLRTVVDGG